MSRRLVWVPMAISIALLSQVSFASAIFPLRVGSTLSVTPPPCLLCHTTEEGEKGTATKPFALTLRGYGLMKDDATTLVSILNQMKTKGTDDSDGDGVGDIAEIEQGRDPNINDITGKSPNDYPPPSYGCSVSARGRDANRAPLAGLAMLGAFASHAHRSSRRRSRR
ncbi:MAG: hypothetical protein ABW133_13925 [Polyangiaceae bacterium]